MGLSNDARNNIATAIVTGTLGGTAFNNANSHIGVGSGTTGYLNTQQDLTGGSKFRKPMDATYPQQATNVLTFRSTFALADANFAWEEWGVFNHVSNATGAMLNRKVEALGTKANTQSWQFTVTLTLTAS